MEGKWYNIEYKGLYIICSHCGCYDHHSKNCLNLAKAFDVALK